VGVETQLLLPPEFEQEKEAPKVKLFNRISYVG